MSQCGICQNHHDENTKTVVVCGHHKSTVHLGCCVDRCSFDKRPCQHAIGIFDKIG